MTVPQRAQRCGGTVNASSVGLGGGWPWPPHSSWNKRIKSVATRLLPTPHRFPRLSQKVNLSINTHCCQCRMVYAYIFNFAAVNPTFHADFTAQQNAFITYDKNQVQTYRRISVFRLFRTSHFKFFSSILHHLICFGQIVVIC